jgi:hypothetical protein
MESTKLNFNNVEEERNLSTRQNEIGGDKTMVA